MVNLEELDKWGEELIGWNYGTIHKQYDRDETCEVLEEDTKGAIETLKAIVIQLLTEAQLEQLNVLASFDNPERLKEMIGIMQAELKEAKGE